MNTQDSILSIWAPVVAGVVTLLLTRLMLASTLFSGIQDVPNGRSLHHTPTPRIGGLAMMLSVLAAWLLLNETAITWLLYGVVVLMLISLVDDLRDLSARVRLLGHLVVSTGFILFGLPHMTFFWAALLVVGMVWMTNLYNFMDGANGLAGGMAAIGFGFYALASGLEGDLSFALMNLAIVAASLAFLTFNFGRASVFMGDAGSIPLGFIAGAIGLLGWQRGLWPLWFPVIVFSCFVLDATVTLLKRLLRGERVWEAHREHYYQRLIQMGWSHQKTALVEYAIMLASGGVALVAIHRSFIVVTGLIGIFLLIALYLMRVVDLRWRHRG
jgi:UDP-N-acetylmuramyl pentapeptide phosphotransferase/UDP-N-acetylglucosamine-1-phosphate transferase